MGGTQETMSKIENINILGEKQPTELSQSFVHKLIEFSILKVANIFCQKNKHENICVFSTSSAVGVIFKDSNG